MKASALVRQDDAPWGIARLSTGSNRLPPNSDPSDNFPFVFDDLAGNGTDVYVLDTGIFTKHEDFGDRADLLASFVGGEDNSTDLNGRTSHFDFLLLLPGLARFSTPSTLLPPNHTDGPCSLQTAPTAPVR
jgi:subtilisin family serine protease